MAISIRMNSYIDIFLNILILKWKSIQSSNFVKKGGIRRFRIRENNLYLDGKIKKISGDIEKNSNTTSKMLWPQSQMPEDL